MHFETEKVKVNPDIDPLGVGVVFFFTFSTLFAMASAPMMRRHHISAQSGNKSMQCISLAYSKDTSAYTLPRC
jgi:hypothetical protein